MPLFSAPAKQGVRIINEKLNLCMLQWYALMVCSVVSRTYRGFGREIPVDNNS